MLGWIKLIRYCLRTHLRTLLIFSFLLKVALFTGKNCHYNYLYSDPHDPRSATIKWLRIPQAYTNEKVIKLFDESAT
jgi:hypothetical protein